MFFSVLTLAQMHVAGPKNEKLATALRLKMDVHAVEIREIKEKKIVSALDGVLSFFDQSLTSSKSYSMKMIITESVFNDKKHQVQCDVIENKIENETYVLDCQSNTAKIKNMIFFFFI